MCLYYNNLETLINHCQTIVCFINKEDTAMAYAISDACVACGACEAQCPVGAISMGDGKFEIDPEKCIDCGSCAGACPTGSIDQA